MSLSIATARVVPTLTEVLEVSTLQVIETLRTEASPAGTSAIASATTSAATAVEAPGDLAGQLAGYLADASAIGHAEPADPLRQAVLSAVDAALAQFRVHLLAQLEPLFDSGAAQQSERTE